MWETTRSDSAIRGLLLLIAFDGTGNSDPAQPNGRFRMWRSFSMPMTGWRTGKDYVTGINTTSADMPYKGSELSATGSISGATWFDDLEKFHRRGTGAAPSTSTRSASAGERQKHVLDQPAGQGDEGWQVHDQSR